MFQLDAVDTGPDLGDHDVLETFEMGIRHKRRTTRTELQSFLSLDLFLLTFKNISLALDLRGCELPFPVDSPL